MNLSSAVAVLSLIPLLLSPAEPPNRSCLVGDPARDRLAFTRTSPGNQGIWTIRGDGTDLRRVTTRAGDGRPSWSADGGAIAFSRQDPAGDFEVYLVNADGTGARNLTNRHETGDLMPAWSPDGDWIAYHSAPKSPIAGSDTARPGDWEILATRTDGQITRNLTQHRPQVGEFGDRAGADVKPAWSPDSRTLLFESYRGSANAAAYNSELWVMPLDNPGAAVALTHTPLHSEWFPAWSPDGTRVAFMRQQHGSNFDIWVLQLGPSRTVMGEVNLTPNLKHDWTPSWSPDSRRIAFSSTRADGGMDVNVTGSGWNVHDPRSDQLADDRWDLYVMNADGTCATPLTGLGDARDPAYRRG